MNDETRKKYKFTIRSSKCIFRTLTPEDVSQSYVDALKKTRGVIKKVPGDINIEWQWSYIQKILLSPCDAICGLFMDSELIGTAGIQNLSLDGVANRDIELAQGYTYGCTLGILVLDKG